MRGVASHDVERRREKYGSNEVKKKKPPTLWEVFVNEIKEPMQILLIVVGVVYSILGEWFDAVFIFIIIALVVFAEVLSFFSS